LKEKLVQTYFGGQVASQVICKDCPHRSERLEPFYTLSLDIRNKKSVEEALELFVQGELRDGDNRVRVLHLCLLTHPHSLFVVVFL
jgi:ubiquitin carboxyl-terminal hydrolase 34